MLGVKLFDRLPRGVRPTWYGETMIRHARMALASLSQAHEEIDALKAGRFGSVSIGTITAPAITLLPDAVAQVKAAHPSLRIGLQIETSDLLIDRLSQGKLDMVVGRLFPRHDKTDLRYQALVEEPVAAVVRPGHPLMDRKSLTLPDLLEHGWIVPPLGSVLRHRVELMFQEAGLPVPSDLIETTALLFMTKMMEQSDLIGVVASDVALYYQEHGLVAILPLELPCKMDSFGLITRTDRLLAPAAKVMLRAIKTVAHSVYGTVLDASDAA
jgi:DNA-binding transcriptional LysR family regulator